jgi:hypothetical protein
MRGIGVSRGGRPYIHININLFPHEAFMSLIFSSSRFFMGIGPFD